MKIEHLQHKHGGRITELTAIGHDTEDGNAFWFYRGNVDWPDGGKSVDLEIAPWAVCYDHDDKAADTEYDKVSEALATYLREQGAWTAKDLRPMWKPKTRTGRVAL
jgi:hypothetical protein